MARFPAIHGKTWNDPALAEGNLLVRNAAEMACFSTWPRRELNLWNSACPQHACVQNILPVERWLSGLKRTPGKREYPKNNRGFDSLSLRQFTFPCRELFHSLADLALLHEYLQIEILKKSGINE